MDVKKICGALMMGATLLAVQSGSIQAFGDANSANAKRISDDQAIYKRSHTPGTPEYQKRLAGDARNANASRIRRSHERGGDVAIYRRSHTPGTAEYAKRIRGDQDNYRISHTPGTPQYAARVNADVSIANATRARHAHRKVH